MNGKGQVAVGSLIVLAIGLIVGLVLITDGISEPVGLITTTTSINTSYTAPASAGVAINIPYQALKGTIVVINGTSGTIIPAANYTIANYVLSNGALVSTLTANAGNSLGWHGKSINVSSSVVEPFGYDTNSGGRAITSLIIIFAAIALVVVAVSVVLKNGGFIFN